MTSRALLVGCNYPGTQAELRGCINDVHSVNEMLQTYYGFSPDNIRILIDTDASSPQPTGINIKSNLKELVAASTGEDILVFHFSGHGTQIADTDGGEADNKDEAICPTDMNLICDDDLRDILAPLPPTVKFTMISDCCHSGSMLDHPEQQISGNKDPNAPAGPADMDMGALMGMFFKGAPEDGERDMKNRAMPQNIFAQLLGSKLGTDVAPNQVRSMLQKGFGDDGSKKMMGLLTMAAAMALKQSKAGGENAKTMGLISKLLGMCLGSTSSATEGPAGVPGVPGVPTAAPVGGTGAPAGGPAAGDTKNKSDQGVLITGCQAHETSADACPSGNPAKAFGALTNALTTTVKAVKAQNPDAEITNKQLVQQVRETLRKTKFAQNPCLECADNHCETKFILG